MSSTFHVLSESRRSATYVNGYIKYGTLNDTYQLALCERWLLEMKSAHYSVRRFAFIVLYEMDFAYLFIKSALGKRFKKGTPSVISEDSGLQDKRASIEVLIIFILLIQIRFVCMF